MSGSVEAMLAGLAASAGTGRGRRDGRTSLSLEACLAALNDRARRMSEPCPFKIGDVVTVVPGSDVKGAGQPHIVVDVLAEPVVDYKAEAGSNQFLRKYTMRVAHFHGDDLTVHAVDHSTFEPWTEAHADAWRAHQNSVHRGGGRRVTPETALTEVVRLLRGEGKRLVEAKISWKKGELVEILGHEASSALRPMRFEGRAVGVVETVDHSDDTTRVVYFDVDGERCSQWFKPVDLRPFSAVEPVAP